MEYQNSSNNFDLDGPIFLIDFVTDRLMWTYTCFDCNLQEVVTTCACFRFLTTPGGFVQIGLSALEDFEKVRFANLLKTFICGNGRGLYHKMQVNLGNA